MAPAKGHTVPGGQVAVAAMCQKLGPWSLLREEPALDPRKDRTRGFAPEVMAALAYNLLTALKLLELPAEHHAWRVRTLIRHHLTLPAKLWRHARGLALRLYCPAGWMDWWRLWRQRAYATA